MLPPFSSFRGGNRLAALILGFTFLRLALWAEAPAWWTQHGVLIPGATPDDYAAVNQGQVKHLAQQAYEEFTSHPPGAGATLTSIWDNPSASTDDYRAVNLGQLKNIAKPFYDRLAEVGYAGQPLISGQIYPWSNASSPTDDYALANIGQVKNVFSFDLALLDLDSDGDGATDAQERLSGTNPQDYFNGQVPVIRTIDGGDQSGPPGHLLPLPWTVRVTNAAGQPMCNAPVTFSASTDTAGFSTTPDGSQITRTLIVRTDPDGLAWVYWKL